MQFNFDLYKPSIIESWISSIYQQNSINTPQELSMQTVANIFNIELIFYDGPVFADWEDDNYACIFLNQHNSYDVQNNDFFHELCHPLRHVGCQSELPVLFQQLQERQAAQFQLVAAMPIYLVRQVPTQLYWERYIDDLAHIFQQPKRFVQKRIHQIINNINHAHYCLQLSKIG